MVVGRGDAISQRRALGPWTEIKPGDVCTLTIDLDAGIAALDGLFPRLLDRDAEEAKLGQCRQARIFRRQRRHPRIRDPGVAEEQRGQ